MHRQYSKQKSKNAKTTTCLCALVFKLGSSPQEGSCFTDFEKSFPLCCNSQHFILEMLFCDLPLFEVGKGVLLTKSMTIFLHPEDAYFLWLQNLKDSSYIHHRKCQVIAWTLRSTNGFHTFTLCGDAGLCQKSTHLL